MNNNVLTVATTPYNDQNPGTSGLRKKCKVYMQQNYTENFIQAILNTIPQDKIGDATLIVGGDGRFLCYETTETVIKIASANKIKKILVCRHGICSTPGISHLIRKTGAIGAIDLTASHNPGGPSEDFGIKYNVSNGGPAPESVTNMIYEITKVLKNYYICPTMIVDIDTINSTVFTISNDKDSWETKVEVINPIPSYVDYMKEIFDFNALKQFLQQKKNGKLLFTVNIDGRSGVAGPYIVDIFHNQLGVPLENLRNYKPLPDFDGKHPDPNLTYCKDFVDIMALGKADFGAAYDGDADRCMILGKNGFFVSPSDSVAVLAANVVRCIPYFKKSGKLTGVARSMPSSSALDVVHEKDLKSTGCGLYETPTGWKYFGNLMDANKLCICGEESFGAGSDHIREKDGIWASLAWLSILADTSKSVEDIMKDHWKRYGRHFYARYDYESLTVEQGHSVMEEMEKAISNNLTGKTYMAYNSDVKYIVEKADNFSYIDPIDKIVSSKQGLRVFFTNKDRIVVRLSGTGSSGSTIRIYMEHYEPDCTKHEITPEIMLKSLVDVTLQIAQIEKLTSRTAPSVIS